jgi:transposase-like protein
VAYADTKEHVSDGVARFAEEYEAKYPKAVACLQQDQEGLLVHFDFPAEHWKHLRTTNIIESPFSTGRLWTRVTKGAGHGRRRC